MPERLNQVEYSLGRIKKLIPESENAKDYLAHTLDQQISSVSEDTPMGIVPSSILSPVKVYASARMAVELLDEPEKLAAKKEGLVDLGIIEWLLRPAMRVKDGLLDQVSAGPWQSLPVNLIEESSRAVCRLDVAVEGYDETVHVGTGFTVGRDARGRDIVMTNAHVLEGALQYGWTVTSSIMFGCDFARYEVENVNRLLPLSEDYNLHPEYDLAILYLEIGKGGEPDTQPIHLTVSAESPDPAVGLKIGVLGHPAFNYSLDPFPKYYGFGDEFGVKRFSPGEVRALEKRRWRKNDVNVFLHDATTLSGSSGSCILDLLSMKVVGLHFGGWPMPKRLIAREGSTEITAELFLANGAVPLWTLH